MHKRCGYLCINFICKQLTNKKHHFVYQSIYNKILKYFYASVMEALSEIFSYVKNIDISMLNSECISNILSEIDGYEEQLILNKETSEILVEIVKFMHKEQKQLFMSKIDIKKIVFKHSGAIFIEKVIDIDLFEKLEKIGFVNLLMNVNSSFVFRKALFIATGKNDKYEVISKHPDLKYIKSIKKSLSTFKLDSYKLHVFISLMHYVRITKSQSFIEKSINFFVKHFDENFLTGKDLFYEEIVKNANKQNNMQICLFLKNKLNSALINKYNYFMQTLLRHSLIKIEIETIEEYNENVILSYYMHLIKHRNYDEFRMLMESKGIKSIFTRFMLIEEELNTKYLDFIKMFYKMKDDFGVRNDFIENFTERWIYTRSGRELLMSMVSGIVTDEIIKFLDENIDIFFRVKGWRDFELFLREIIKITEGRTKSKANMILRKYKQQIKTAAK